IPQKENAMNRFLNWLGRARGTGAASGNRPRSFRPHLEELDNRLVLSAISSAISIQHNGSIERDWNTVHNAALVEFQGTSRRDLYTPEQGTAIRAVSASIDPTTGSGEAFVIYFDTENPITGKLALCNSHGTWSFLDIGYYGITLISATRDGHVYDALGD